MQFGMQVSCTNAEPSIGNHFSLSFLGGDLYFKYQLVVSNYSR